MNLPSTKKELGVNPDIDFQSCNMQVNQAFALQGDGARNRAKLLPDLIHSGIRLLIYAGDADMACNYIVRDTLCPASARVTTHLYQLAGQRAMGLATGDQLPR